MPSIDVIAQERPVIEIYTRRRTYVDVLRTVYDSGAVRSVTGTAGRIDVDNTDPKNPILNIDPAFEAAILALINAITLEWGAIGGTITDQADLVAYVAAQIAALVDSSPATLDTLKEIATALNNDPDFYNTLTTLVATKEATANKDASGGYAGLTLRKINFLNTLGTFISFFANANTAARTYTFQNRDGTIADDTDLALKENAANKDTDGNLAANSDVKFPSQKAVKTYVDAKGDYATVVFEFTDAVTLADSTSYYFQVDLATTFIALANHQVPFTGTIVSAFLCLSGTAGSTENCTLAIYENGVNLGTAITFNTSVPLTGHSGTGLNIPVVEGRKLVPAIVVPVLATNPASVRACCTLVIKRT